MKKALVLLVCLIGLPVCLLAQYTLSGEVRSEETGETLTGATVRLSNAGRALASDVNGLFVFNNLQQGNYQLKISYVGYKTWEKEVSLNSDQKLEILLKDNGLLDDEVLITATRASAETPTTFTEISEQELEKQNLGQDIPYLLNFTPSVVTTSDAGAGVGYTGMRIRGSDAQRINVTINGIPINDSESHGTFWVNMPDMASSVDNIQIQRGVGTSTNGAAAFGASINIQTERLNPESYAEIQSSIGSFNTQRYTLKAGTGLIKDHFSVDARLSKISSDGYIDRAFSDLKSFFVSGGYYTEKTLLKANIFSGREQTYQAWYGTPEAVVNGDQAGIEAYIDRNWVEDPEQLNNLRNAGRTYNYYTYENETDNYQQDHYQLLFAHDISNSLQLNLAGHYTYGRGYYEQFRPDDELADYGLAPVEVGDASISSTDLVRQRWLDNHFYGFTYSLGWDASRVNLTLGGGLNRYEGDHFGEIIWARYASSSDYKDRYYDNSSQKTDFNTFLKGLFKLTNGLDLYADLQIRAIDYSFGGLDHGGATIAGDYQYFFVNPKAGLSYQLLSNHRLYGSYAIAQREPVRSDFIDAPTGQIPTHEVLHNLELGYEGKLSRVLQLSANYYLMNYNNQLVLTGELNDVGSPIRINVPQSYRTGLELQLAYQPLKVLRLQANSTISRNVIQRYNEAVFSYDTEEFVRQEMRDSPISFSPNLIVNGIITYMPLSNLELSLLNKYVGRQYLDNTGSKSRSLAGYGVSDFRVNYTIKPRFIEEIGINLLVNNIFDAMYASNGYTWGYISGGETIYENFLYPQAGINFLLGVNLKF